MYNSVRNHPGPNQLKFYSSYTNCERGRKTVPAHIGISQDTLPAIQVS